MWGWHTYASVNDHISVVFCYQNIRETELLIASNNAILYTRDLHLIPLSGNPNVWDVLRTALQRYGFNLNATNYSLKKITLNDGGYTWICVKMTQRTLISFWTRISRITRIFLSPTELTENSDFVSNTDFTDEHGWFFSSHRWRREHWFVLNTNITNNTNILISHRWHREHWFVSNTDFTEYKDIQDVTWDTSPTIKGDALMKVHPL